MDTDFKIIQIKVLAKYTGIFLKQIMINKIINENNIIYRNAIISGLSES